jgi:hypothetical protein
MQIKKMIIIGICALFSGYFFDSAIMPTFLPHLKETPFGGILSIAVGVITWLLIASLIRLTERDAVIRYKYSLKAKGK